ncbi:MAG: glycosyltransferase family 4 protein [Nitrososphaeria archaeon]
MRVGIFTYADTLTGGNIRLLRALRHYPRDEIVVLIPSDRHERLRVALERVNDPSLRDLERTAIDLKPLGARPSAIDYIRYGKYAGDFAKKEGFDLLYLYHEHAYFPLGFSLSGVRWTMLMQLTPVVGSLAIEEGRGFSLFRKNYQEIYGYGRAKALRGYLRLRLFDLVTGRNVLLASSRSIPYELELLGIRKRILVPEVPNATDGCARIGGRKDLDVIFFSRVKREKGVFHYIEAISMMRDLIRSACIVGYADEHMRRALERELAKRGLDFVCLLYNARKEEAHEIVSRSKLLIYPSMMDSFSYSLMESLSCGTPAVAYSIPGVRLNYSTPAVRLVEPMDIRALAEEASKVLESGEWQEMGRAGIEYTSRFTWEAMAESELKTVKRILEEDE